MSDIFEVVQPPISTRPLAETELWELVMEAADYRCQCTGGLCGSLHSASALRCKARHDQGRVRLVAAPADLALSDIEATTVPIGDLRAWCGPCFQAARRRARLADAARREQENGPADTLF
ncbi:hypothetical protein [Streptomyces sp. NPDC001914]|uniref:hypothetical protein n=1 Tax=Streptomyces sp. NPDC001914 TaxID=3364623 RepID=UPI0036B30AFC